MGQKRNYALKENCQPVKIQVFYFVHVSKKQKDFLKHGIRQLWNLHVR